MGRGNNTGLEAFHTEPRSRLKGLVGGYSLSTELASAAVRSARQELDQASKQTSKTLETLYFRVQDMWLEACRLPFVYERANERDSWKTELNNLLRYGVPSLQQRRAAVMAYLVDDPRHLEEMSRGYQSKPHRIYAGQLRKGKGAQLLREQRDSLGDLESEAYLVNDRLDEIRSAMDSYLADYEALPDAHK